MHKECGNDNDNDDGLIHSNNFEIETNLDKYCIIVQRMQYALPTVCAVVNIVGLWEVKAGHGKKKGTGSYWKRFTIAV
jgi:hypothetical protein